MTRPSEPSTSMLLGYDPCDDVLSLPIRSEKGVLNSSFTCAFSCFLLYSATFCFCALANPCSQHKETASSACLPVVIPVLQRTRRLQTCRHCRVFRDPPSPGPPRGTCLFGAIPWRSTRRLSSRVGSGLFSKKLSACMNAIYFIWEQS